MNRIKCIRTAYELSQKQFAAKLNVDQTAVSKWENAKNNIDIEIIAKISQEFGVPMDFVCGKEFRIQRPISSWHKSLIEDYNNAAESAKEFFLFKYGRGIFEDSNMDGEDVEILPNRIPVYGTVAAGIPIEAITNIEDYEEITEEMAKAGAFAALKIKGDSMEPRFTEGDIVIIKLQEDVNTGDIAIVMIANEEATCKKIKKTPEGVMLISTNPKYEPMFYSNKEIMEKPVKIWGKVVELRAKF